MFSLIFASLMAYGISKGCKIDNFGSHIVVLVISDLIALSIIFN